MTDLEETDRDGAGQLVTPDEPPVVDLVTGALGNTGSAIAVRLRDDGVSVRTLTNRVPDETAEPAPSSEEEDDESDGGDEEPTGPPPLDVHPHAFGDPDALGEAFRGVRTFYNTYWMRTGDPSGYATAVARSKELIDAAAAAGVERIVHLSVLGASIDSPYAYFRSKAEVEEHGRASGVPFAAVRPALIFGGDSALLSNLAWMLRRLPVMAIAGDGRYRVRPVHVDDVADLCLALGSRDLDGDPEEGWVVVDAVGPDRPTYDELVHHVRAAVGSTARLVHLPVQATLAGGRALGWVLEDQVLTRDELESTIAGIADSDGPATGSTSVLEWIHRRGNTLGRTWTPSGR